MKTLPATEPSSRRAASLAAYVGAALLVLVLAGLTWLAIGPSSQAPVRSQMTPSARLPAPAVIEPMVTAVPAEAAVGSAEPKSGRIEVCDVGTFDAESDGPTEALEQQTQLSMQKIIAHFRSRPDERSRAYGALMLMSLDAERDAAVRSKVKECKQNPSAFCDPTVPEVERPWQRESLEELARLAVQTTDAEVYRRAWLQCAKEAHPQSRAERAAGGIGSYCSQLSLQRWTALDAGNAVPWLYQLEEAAQRGDDGLADEALYRAGAAQTWINGWGRLPAAILSAEGMGVPRGIVAFAALQAVGVDAATMVPFMALLKRCKGPAVADANRRQTCESIADLMVTRGDTALDARFGGSLGKALGWSAERLQRINDEYDAFAGYALEVIPDDDLFSCASFAAARQYWSEIVTGGELGPVRNAVKRSGKSMQAWAERGRQGMKEFSARRAAAEAAVAASRPGAEP